MTAKITYHGRKDSFCDYSQDEIFVRASELVDSDYWSLVTSEASDQDVREAIEALEGSA